MCNLPTMHADGWMRFGRAGLVAGVWWARLPTLRRAEEVGPGLRRALVGSHVVFFREDAAAVTVVRVLHQSMDVGV